jgi:hypothetical protein
VNTGPYFDVAHEIAGLGGDHPDRHAALAGLLRDVEQ